MAYLVGWTPTMHISVCLTPVGLQRTINPSSGAPRVARLPSARAALRRVCDYSPLVLLPHHQAARLTHAQGSRASLGAEVFHLPNSNARWGSLSVAFAPSYEFGSLRISLALNVIVLNAQSPASWLPLAILNLLIFYNF